MIFYCITGGMSLKTFSFLLVAGIVLAGSPYVYGDQCSLYRDADEKHRECLGAMFQTRNGSPSGTVIDVYGNSCKNMSAYTKCMEQYSSNCANKGVIMAEVSNLGATCDGQNVADWFKNDVAPDFDKVKRDCMRAVAAKPACKVALAELDVYPRYSATTEEGIQTVQTYMNAFFTCFKEDAQAIVPEATACSGVTWQEVFTFTLSNIYLGGSEILGRVLSGTQLNELKTLASGGQ